MPSRLAYCELFDFLDPASRSAGTTTGDASTSCCAAAALMNSPACGTKCKFATSLAVIFPGRYSYRYHD